jgi:hypothetical protein
MIEELEVVADFRRVNSRGFDVLAGETEGEWRFGNGRGEVSRPPRGGLGYEKWNVEGNMDRKYRGSTDKAKQGLD